MALSVAASVTAGLGSVQSNGAEGKTAEIAAPGTAKEPNPKLAAEAYPISGYFISASSRDSANYKKLADIKAFGGDTVITFGTSLQPATLESLPSDCTINGKSCARVAAGPLSVDRFFTLLDGSNWGDTALKCPNDRKVTNNGQSYVVLVLPQRGQECTSSDGKYDVVVVGGGSSSAVDPSRSLADAATKLGMKFYAGMPAPAKRADLPYLPDVSYLGTLTLLTERFLAYQRSANDVRGLAGFYHHTEMPLTDSSTFDSVLDLYSSQNRAIHRILPTRQAIVSPYIDARLTKTGISLQKAQNGIRRIAQTSEGVVLNIAIQDGMGTGKGAAFTGSEANSTVDPFAASIVGNGTWGNKYLAPNKEYFSAAAAGIAGTGAVLWANLEGMAPATASNYCADSLRGQTTKARLDRQLQQMANARKVISFMWDSYFTCKGNGTPLKNQILKGLSTPIITDTTFRPASGQVQVAGFNLKGSTATLEWTDQKGKQLTKSVKASSINSDYGEQYGLNPQLEMITVDVGSTTVKSPGNYYVKVTNVWGNTSPKFHSELG
ncbi:hypothetical protein J2Y66_002459 [Paenarthrobacter nitroguajacolicus]|uniref:hypothetical protein n=1 Tax=Paenarthrobacter nitroguajacolicus TaxID=211146 RepID=UPI0028645468|nr:hypothetical protein [Paenarthrobacter nitroguajacolicus]MDR6987961.1 hypothetical protein [Paenarthrobacter nitroguajacolicus]